MSKLVESRPAKSSIRLHIICVKCLTCDGELKLHTNMSFRATVLKRSLLVAILFRVGASAAALARPKLSGQLFQPGCHYDLLGRSAHNPGASEFGTTAREADTAQWLKVEIHLPRPTRRPTYLDSVDVQSLDRRPRHFVERMPAVPARAWPWSLTGTVTYVNIPNNGQGCLRRLLRSSLHAGALQRR